MYVISYIHIQQTSSYRVSADGSLTVGNNKYPMLMWGNYERGHRNFNGLDHRDNLASNNF